MTNFLINITIKSLTRYRNSAIIFIQFINTLKRGKFMKTLTYIAEPENSKCKWWCKEIPGNLDSVTARISGDYIKAGADLELPAGTILLESEERHHRKSRGYQVQLILVLSDKNGNLFRLSFSPSLATKKRIKKTDSDLMYGSGDVAACLRAAIFLKRQETLAIGIRELLNAEDVTPVFYDEDGITEKSVADFI